MRPISQVFPMNIQSHAMRGGMGFFIYSFGGGEEE